MFLARRDDEAIPGVWRGDTTQPGAKRSRKRWKGLPARDTSSLPATDRGLHPQPTWSFDITPRRILVTLALVLALTGGLLIHRLGPPIEELDRRWQAQAGFDPLVTYPERDANTAARRLEELIAPLGLEIAPSDDLTRAHPSAEMVEAMQSIHAATGAYLRSWQLSSPSFIGPPSEVTTWLTFFLPNLDEIAILIETSEPRWELHLAENLSGPLPSFLDHLQLHRLLLLAASESARSGDHLAVGRWVATANRLEQTVLPDPRLLPQLIAMTERRETLSLLRALDTPPKHWQQSVLPQPWRQRVHRSLRLETWLMLQALRTGSLEAEMDAHPLATLPTRWWLRACATQYIKAMEHAIQRLEAVDPRYFERDEFYAEESVRIPRWAIFARMLFPNLFDSSIKAARLQLDSDLTGHLLSLRERLLTCKNDSPVLPAAVPSSIHGISWLYSIKGSDLWIRASDEVPTSTKHPLPLEVMLTLPDTCTPSLEGPREQSEQEQSSVR